MGVKGEAGDQRVEWGGEWGEKTGSIGERAKTWRNWPLVVTVEEALVRDV